MVGIAALHPPDSNFHGNLYLRSIARGVLGPHDRGGDFRLALGPSLSAGGSFVPGDETYMARITARGEQGHA